MKFPSAAAFDRLFVRTVLGCGYGSALSRPADRREFPDRLLPSARRRQSLRRASPARQICPRGAPWRGLCRSRRAPGVGLAAASGHENCPRLPHGAGLFRRRSGARAVHGGVFRRGGALRRRGLCSKPPRGVRPASRQRRPADAAGVRACRSPCAIPPSPCSFAGGQDAMRALFAP